MAAKIFPFSAEEMETAYSYWHNERDVSGDDNFSVHRLYGVMGEMAAFWYLEEYYPVSAVLPYGLMTRAGVCNKNGFNAGDLVMVRRNNTTWRFEVKATTVPARRWMITEKDAAQYARDGIDQVIFVSLDVTGALPEAEIYGRVAPGEILCLWTPVDDGGIRYLVNPEPPAPSVNTQRWIAKIQKNEAEHEHENF